MINEGFVDYLAKSFKKEDIVNKIKENLVNKDVIFSLLFTLTAVSILYRNIYFVEKIEISCHMV